MIGVRGPMSRLTFREKAGAVCWQKQRRDRYLAEGVPPVPHLDVKRAIVRPISRAQAEQVILKYEWLGTMSPTSLHFGIFYGNYCAGVTCVGFGASMAGAYHADQFGIGTGDLLTLARGACAHWAPSHSNSKLIGWTCRMVGARGKLMWATCDTDAGEIGTIYQACNFVYIGASDGVTRADREIVAPSGRVYNQRSIGGWAKTRKVRYESMKGALLDNGWSFQPGNPKHRYVYLLDRSDRGLVSRIESMRRPYPKRVRSAENGTAGTTSRGRCDSDPDAPTASTA